MHLTALPRQTQNRRCGAAIQCIARRMLTMVRIAARECQTCALPLWGPRLRMACPLRPLYSQWRVANCQCWTSRHASYQRIPTLRCSSRFLLRYLFESSLTSSRFLGITDQCAWESLSSLETICEIKNGDIPWLRDLGVASARRFDLRFDGQRTRSRSRNGPTVVSWRRTHLLQLRLYHAQPDARNIGRRSFDCPSYLFARS